VQRTDTAYRFNSPSWTVNRMLISSSFLFVVASGGPARGRSRKSTA
jgi:hypothetical protein